MLIFKKRVFFFFNIYKSSKVRGQILCETVHVHNPCLEVFSWRKLKLV